MLHYKTIYLFKDLLQCTVIPVLCSHLFSITPKCKRLRHNFKRIVGYFKLMIKCMKRFRIHDTF